MFEKAFTVSFLVCVVAVTLLAGCGSQLPPASQLQVASAPEVWESIHHPVSVQLSNGWAKANLNTPGDTADEPDKLIMSFVNESGPYSYIVRLEPDIPSDQLSMEAYTEAVKNQYLSAGYELIDGGEVMFRNRPCHRLQLKVAGTKGLMGQSVFLHRDGKHLTTIQWTFPLASNDAFDVPAALLAFNDGVTIGGQ